MSFYTIDSLTFSYNKANKLFKDISFSIEKDQYIGLVGPNGCGKTTLVKLMLGIIKLQQGEVYLEGKSIKDMPLCDIGKKVGFVFQNPEKQLFCPTVWEQMSFSYKYGDKVYNSEVEDRINYYLELFDIIKYKDLPPFKLSGGEKQRLALASVLIRDVEFIIMDEPTTNLDVLRMSHLEKCLETLRKENKGYMIISHDRGFLERNVDKLLTMGPQGVETD
jgi:energy-coupling factor transport system ATP-binding protein